MKRLITMAVAMTAANLTCAVLAIVIACYTYREAQRAKAIAKQAEELVTLTDALNAKAERVAKENEELRRRNLELTVMLRCEYT